jgi:hypothetical protein
MKKILALIFLSLAAAAASEAVPAAQMTVTWTLPTEFTADSGGGAIPAARFSHTRVVWKECAALAGFDFTGGASVDVPYPGTSSVIDGVTAGVQYCVRLRTVLKDPYMQSEPAASAEAAHLVPAPVVVPVPNPPTNILLTRAVVPGANMAPVFKLTSTGKRSAEAAGFIQVGVPCTGNVMFTYRNDSYRKVDSVRVQWWGVVATDSVAAPCG